MPKGLIIPERPTTRWTHRGRRLDREPAAVYLMSLGTKSGRDSMLSALNTAARLLGFADAGDAPWASLRYAHLTALRTLLGAEYAPATANKILSAVRGTLAAAWRLNLMSGEDYRRAASVKAVRGSRLPAGRGLESGEIKALFANIDATTAGGARDAALLAMLYGCGLRRAEAAAARVEDLDDERTALRIRGKGNRERDAPVNTGVRAAIDNWLQHRGTAPGPLLCRVSRHGLVEPVGLSPGAVRLRLETRAKQAGIGHCSPHDLRRTYVSTLLDEGADISTVARMAGHANVQTTARYDRRGERAARTAAEQIHVPYQGPRSGTEGEETAPGGDGEE